MKIIAFDVMGNDNGIAAAIEAVNDFVKKNANFRFILVGNKKEIVKKLHVSENISIVNVEKEVNKNEGLLAARKKDSSMVVAINLVKEGKANVVISSGDSGTYLAMTTLQLKRLNGFKRPAFMPIFPTIVPNKKLLISDVGANLEVTSDMLIQWAKVSILFSKKIIGVKNPSVAIINVGHEKNKGKEFHQEAYKKLKQDKKINFKGFIEPRELLNGIVDIAITDGYAGNMILKTMEGSISTLLNAIKSALKSKLKYKIGALIAKGAFKQIKNNIDYRNVGSAWVIGLNKLAIKCHGGADKKSYLGAFSQIKLALDNGLEEVFNEEKYE